MGRFLEDTEDSRTTIPSGKGRFIEPDPGMDESVLNRHRNNFDWFSQDDWSKALEGLGIATGVTDELKPGESRISSIGDALSEGSRNFVHGAQAASSDIASFLTPEPISQEFDKYSREVRASIPENSVAGVLGEEAPVAVLSGPAGKMAGEAIGSILGEGIGYGVGKFKQGIYNKGRKYGTEIKKGAKNAYDEVIKRHGGLADESDHAIERAIAREMDNGEHSPLGVLDRDEKIRMAANRARQAYIDSKMKDMPLGGTVKTAAEVIDAVKPGKRRWGTLVSAFDKFTAPFWKPNAYRTLNNDAIKYGIKKGALDNSEMRKLFKQKIRNMPAATAQKYQTALEKVLANMGNRGGNVLGYGNALDSALQKALDNIENNSTR